MFLSGVGVAASVAAGAAAQQPLLRVGLRRELVGCYALRRAGGPPLQRGRPVQYLDAVPSDPARPAVGFWRVLAPPDTAPGPSGPSLQSWAADSLTDSVRLWLQYGNGVTRVALRAPGRPAVGAVLRGWTESYGDMAGDGPILVGGVRAERVPCAAPAPRDHRAAAQRGVAAVAYARTLLARFPLPEYHDLHRAVRARSSTRALGVSVSR